MEGQESILEEKENKERTENNGLRVEARCSHFKRCESESAAIGQHLIDMANNRRPAMSRVPAS